MNASLGQKSQNLNNASLGGNNKKEETKTAPT